MVAWRTVRIMIFALLFMAGLWVASFWLRFMQSATALPGQLAGLFSASATPLPLPPTPLPPTLRTFPLGNPILPQYPPVHIDAAGMQAFAPLPTVLPYTYAGLK